MNKLNKSDILHITSYMLVETELRPADICMVFGGANADHLADHAAELYRQGLFKKIIVSGGVATDDGTLEADRMQARLIGWGIPEKDIMVEDKATNTGGNVIHAMSMLDKEIGIDKIESIIAIGQIHACRRFLMTLEQQWPNVTKMFSAPNYYPVDKKDWYKNNKFRADVLREYAKIEPYKQQGFIKEIDMDTVAKKIKALPVANKNRPTKSSGYNHKFKP